MLFPELALELRDAVRRANAGEIVVSIHLFGIRNERSLRGVPLKELVDAAGIPASYHTEIHKGMKLAKYVSIR